MTDLHTAAKQDIPDLIAGSLGVSRGTAYNLMREALAEQTAQLPFGVGGGLVAIKTLLSRDPCVHANTAIQMIDAILAEQPSQREPSLSTVTNRDSRKLPAQCWKCGDADPAFTDICQVPACGMKE